MLVCLRRDVVGQHARDAFDERPKQGEVLRSRYLVTSELAEGSFAKSFLAKDKKTKTQVCIKRHNFLSVEALTDLMVIAHRVEEADAKEMFFPRLLDTFFDVSSFTVESLIQGHHCLAMEKIEPGFFQNVRHLQILACDVLQGLKKLESAGVVHNDLKADNFMWCKASPQHRRPHVKIVDFGSARIDQREQPGRNWNLAEGGQGHLGKWSPEMILKLPISHVTDVWGLAITLCELHTGRCMWRGGRDTAEMILAQAMGLCKDLEKKGIPVALLKQSPANIRSFITPGPRHLPVCCGAEGMLEMLEPQEWGLNQVLGVGWGKNDKEKFGALLETALVMNPQKRPTASEILEKCSFVKPTLVGTL